MPSCLPPHQLCCLPRIKTVIKRTANTRRKASSSVGFSLYFVGPSLRGTCSCTCVRGLERLSFSRAGTTQLFAENSSPGPGLPRPLYEAERARCVPARVLCRWHASCAQRFLPGIKRLLQTAGPCAWSHLRAGFYVTHRTQPGCILIMVAQAVLRNTCQTQTSQGSE